MIQEDYIDVHKLTIRELLIQVHNKVELLENGYSEQALKQQSMDIELAVMKTKMQLLSAVIGFAAGLLSSVITLLISKSL